MKLVFYGFGAFVRSVAGNDVYFSTQNPNQNPHMFVPLDLDKNPQAALAGKILWDEVIVDDIGDVDAKFTSINPRPGGRNKGGVYIEAKYLALLRRLWPLPIPDPKCKKCQDYEFMSVRYYAEDLNLDSRRVGKRYLGYHAKILDRGTRDVQVWHAGTSCHPNPPAPVVIRGLDFGDPEQCDYTTGAHGHTQIGVSPGLPDEGALFLKDSFARGLQPVALMGIKKPPGEGI